MASIYCVVENDEAAIIETGTTFSLPHVKQCLVDNNISPSQIKYVIPTHVHLDHAGGAGVMMQAFENAELVIHPRGARHMIDPSKLIEGTKAIYGDEAFEKLYGEIPAIDESRIIIGEHENTVSLSNRDFLIIDTPGHAYHHFCLVDSNSSSVFSGDTFGISYPDFLSEEKRFILPSTTPIHFNPETLHDSIDLIMSFKPEQIFLTHFNVLPNPQQVVDHYREWVDIYVEVTEQVKPEQNNMLPELIAKLTTRISDYFKISPEDITKRLGNDLELNSQGLAYWYQHRD